MRIFSYDKTACAIRHTGHCLVGCGIGEILGMLLSSQFGRYRLGGVALAVPLAFLFGCSLTYRSVRSQVSSSGEAIKITLATDTTSITSMEIIDLCVAFIVTVPVNRFMLARQPMVH